LSTIHQLKQSCGIFTNTLHADFMTLEQKLCQSREATQMNTKYSSIVINKNDTCAKDAEVRNGKNECQMVWKLLESSQWRTTKLLSYDAKHTKEWYLSRRWLSPQICSHPLAIKMFAFPYYNQSMSYATLDIIRQFSKVTKGSRLEQPCWWAYLSSFTVYTAYLIQSSIKPYPSCPQLGSSPHLYRPEDRVSRSGCAWLEVLYNRIETI
jgi:hypothetical protein